MKIANRILAVALLALTALKSVLIIVNFANRMFSGGGIIGGAGYPTAQFFMRLYFADGAAALLMVVLAILNTVYQFSRKQRLGFGTALIILNVVCCVMTLAGTIASHGFLEISLFILFTAVFILSLITLIKSKKQAVEVTDNG